MTPLKTFCWICKDSIINPNSRAVSETAALCPSSMDPLITNGSSSLNDLDDISVSNQNLLKEDDINEDLLLKES